MKLSMSLSQKCEWRCPVCRGRYEPERARGHDRRRAALRTRGEFGTLPVVLREAHTRALQEGVRAIWPLAQRNLGLLVLGLPLLHRRDLRHDLKPRLPAARPIGSSWPDRKRRR